MQMMPVMRGGRAPLRFIHVPAMSTLRPVMPISAEMGRPSSTSRGSMLVVVSSAMRRGMKEMVMSMARMKTNISGRNRALR